MGTNIPATWSARRAMGALELWASSTSLIIWASAVWLPTLRASKVKLPEVLMVAAKT